jgi:hypothetical protein
MNESWGDSPFLAGAIPLFMGAEIPRMGQTPRRMGREVRETGCTPPQMGQTPGDGIFIP